MLGTLSVQLDDKMLVERPIVALSEVKKGGLITRVYDRVGLTVHTLLEKINF